MRVEFGVTMRPVALMGTKGEARPHVAGSLIDMRITTEGARFLWAIVERWPDQMKEAILIGGFEPSVLEASVKAQSHYERILKERGQ